MNTSFEGLNAKVLSFGFYNSGHDGRGQASEPSLIDHQLTVREIHKAQVDLYCSHGMRAIEDISLAQKLLSPTQSLSERAALAALNQAKRLVILSDFSHAELALESALSSLFEPPPLTV